MFRALGLCPGFRGLEAESIVLRERIGRGHSARDKAQSRCVVVPLFCG